MHMCLQIQAAIMFGMRLRHVPVNSDGRVDVKKMAQVITSDTCVVSCFFVYCLCWLGRQCELMERNISDDIFVCVHRCNCM